MNVSAQIIIRHNLTYIAIGPQPIGHPFQSKNLT